MELEDGPQEGRLEETPLIVGTPSEVDQDNYQKVPNPYIPEVRGTEGVSGGAYRILVIPDDDRARGPAIYDDEHLTPLGSSHGDTATEVAEGHSSSGDGADKTMGIDPL